MIYLTLVTRSLIRQLKACQWVGDETQLKCSRNVGRLLSAAVCLADGSVIVDEYASRDNEEACG